MLPAVARHLRGDQDRTGGSISRVKAGAGAPKLSRAIASVATEVLVRHALSTEGQMQTSFIRHLRMPREGSGMPNPVELRKLAEWYAD